MAAKSFLGKVFAGIRSLLVRPEVSVGVTASYPRIEIHSATEAAPEDKAGDVRHITCQVECLSETAMSSVVELNDDNLERVLVSGLDLIGCRIIGVLPGTAQMDVEMSESNMVLYRLLQTVEVWAERDDSLIPDDNN